MLIRLTNKGNPFYVNSDYIESIKGETSGDKSLSVICMRGGPRESEYDQYGIHYADVSPDKVVAEINRQLHIALL